MSGLLSDFREVIHTTGASASSTQDDGIFLLLCMAMMIDGQIKSVEFEKVIQLAEKLGAFADYDRTELRDKIEASMEFIRREDYDPLLDIAFLALESFDDRGKAFRFTAWICRADGLVSPVEHALLVHMAKMFEFSDKEAHDLWEELETQLEKTG